MRRVAAHLGVSKSALYHYFPNKDALFLACTEQVMSKFRANAPDRCGTNEERLEQLMGELRSNFGAEMTLLFDYLRGKSREEIARDDAMQLALQIYHNAVASITGEARANETLAQIMGTLLLEYLAGMPPVSPSAQSNG